MDTIVPWQQNILHIYLSQQPRRLQLVQSTAAKNCRSHTEKRAYHFEGTALIACERANLSQDHVLCVQMLRRQGDGIAGLIPRYVPVRYLRSSSQSRLGIPSADGKHTKHTPRDSKR